jgi:hypothetical protein
VIYNTPVRALSRSNSCGSVVIIKTTSSANSSQNMQSLQEVIALNNEGARLLQSGSTMDAVYLIRRAAVLLKQFPMTIPCVESHVQQAPPTPNPTPCVSSTVQMPSKDDTDMLVEEASYHSPQSPHDGLLYVHFRPMTIPENVLFSSEDHSDVLQILSTFVIFNLALACHHCGKSSGTEAPLERAKELYRVVLGSQGCSGNESALQAMDLVHCLALNNLAHLHYEHCQYEHSLCCMEHMYDLIGQTQCLDDCGYLSSYEAEEIQLNVLYAFPPSVAGAA